ncbi:MAG: hypothetical protein KAY65_02910 [Planctomycetes bacterium]|nr:hypothetical protein [Planctomycetota bacterium]
MLRVCPALLAVLILALAGACSAEESPFNVDFFCGWGGCYRPMQWTPVEIGIGSTLAEPFAGAVILSAPQDGLNTLNIRHRFVLTPDIYLHLPLVTKFAFAADRCSINLIDAKRGRTVWDQKYDLWGRTTRDRMLTAVTENDMLIGHVGGSKFGLLRLPKQSVCRQRQGGRGRVYLGDKLPRMVPWDWTGFVSLDLLILYDPDWNQFNPHQLNAIAQWISNGGRLLLVLGSHPLPANNPIGQLLPVEARQVKEITVDPQMLRKWDLDPGESETVAGWPLLAKPTAGLCYTDSSEADECLFAVGYAGFGRAGVLAFDPSTMTDRQRAKSSEFWVNRITAVLEDDHPQTAGGAFPRDSRPSRRSRNQRDLMLPLRTIEFAEDATRSGQTSQNISHYEVGLAQAANNAVMNYLYKGIRPLSIWWVILLLTVLAVLLGPFDYIILKGKGRLPLTWLTCTFWIALFTVGAYYGVEFLRGGEMEMRVVSVLDGIENNSLAWSTNYCGLFAPRSDDYRLKNLKKNQWWSGIAPTQQSIWSYQREGSARRIYCEQDDGGNRPESLPINIWTIQCLLNESPLERLPYTAQVERSGDEIIVNISNESDAPILSGYVLFDGDRGISFGTVPPEANKQFRGALRNVTTWRSYDANRLRNSYYGGRSSGYSDSFKREDAFFAQGSMQRTQAISAYLEHGAAVVCVEYVQAPVSFAVDARSCKYDHIQLARLVVFPREQNEETGNDQNQESE